MNIYNNLDNKAKFFAQYWGQDVLTFNDEYEQLDTYLLDGSIDDCTKLLLKPLSQITDEDLRALGFEFKDGKRPKIKFEIGGNEDWRSGMFTWGNFQLNDYDYLRSKGYALPFMSLSVEQQVSYGWVKLKTE